jgi:hypothetical protein
MLLAPNSPQGPLLGIFFTGPLGALAGAVLGVFIGLLSAGGSAAAGPWHSRGEG